MVATDSLWAFFSLPLLGNAGSCKFQNIPPGVGEWRHDDSHDINSDRDDTRQLHFRAQHQGDCECLNGYAIAASNVVSVAKVINIGKVAVNVGVNVNQF